MTNLLKYGVTGSYFYGNKISQYGLENGRVDYSTLAKSFDCVLNNTIYNAGWDIDEWEQISGFIDNTAEIEQLQEQIEDYEDRGSMTGCSYAPEIEEARAIIEDLENEQERVPEIFQFYIVSDSGADLLQEINEIVFYNSALDVYLWGVTHWGTSWDYVLTNIPCNTGNYNF